MTFWATLWYSGLVVLQIGYEGQTNSQCEEIISAMISDIQEAYETQTDVLADSVFPDNQFTASCETMMIPIHESFTE